MPGDLATMRKYLYGVSREQYQALLKKQEGKCAICGCGETRLNRSGSIRSLCVDHCHATGKVRGLLCDNCNTLLGRAKDSPAILRRAAAYLEVADTGLGHRRVDADSLIAELANI